MRSQIVFSPIAKEDLKQAVQWYELSKEALGREFSKAVNGKIDLIAEFPDRYPYRNKYLRETPLKKYPYTIVYRYNKRKKLVTISAVYHTSRNPNNKYRR